MYDPFPRRLHSLDPFPLRFHFDEDEHGPAAPEESPLWRLDNIELTSVGIDVGSASSQVVFSRLHLQRSGEDLSSRYAVVAREPIYESPVELTPYAGPDTIDERALGRLIDGAYARAGLRPHEVDVGAVILTGEAMRRHNARAIAEVLARRGGSFVCATAGHNLEATLAAYGSGAAARSYRSGRPVLNVDIGGGTTKLAMAKEGRVVATAALHIGGRLVVFDERGRVARLEPGGEQLVRRVGLGWRVGAPAPAEERERLAQWMADAVIGEICRQDPAPGAAELRLTPPLGGGDGVGGVLFSGGVAAFVYGQEERDFGDLGRALGLALRRRLEAGALPWPVLEVRNSIRATVLGASQYSVQVSGNTIFVSNPDSLPRRNLQVLRPDYGLGGEIDPQSLALAIREHFRRFDLAEGQAEVALAFRWEGPPAYERLAAFVAGVAAGLEETLRRRGPLVLVLEGDVARTVGALLKEEWGAGGDVLAIDGITLQDFDFIDIGRVLHPSGTLPVTIKSLVFRL